MIASESPQVGSYDGIRTPPWVRNYRSTFQPDVEADNIDHQGKQVLLPLRATSKRSHSGSLMDGQIAAGGNILVQLCENKMWKDVRIRCGTHPLEASPVLIKSHSEMYMNDMDVSSPPIKREKLSALDNNVTSYTMQGLIRDGVHSYTPLGIACQLQSEDSNELLVAIRSLLRACPEQLQCNQTVLGNTPLRDAVRNSSCTLEIIEVLLQADMNDSVNIYKKAIFRRDRDGLYPMDHAIMGIHAGKPAHSLETMKLLLSAYHGLVPKFGSNEGDCSQEMVSPLIRLLSLGTPFALRGVPKVRLLRNAPVNETDRLQRILNGAKYLISQNDNAVEASSRSTGCTPLHVAIRNYGNFLPLIQVLLDYDTDNDMVKKRNRYGDLPLHVACSVGVPMSVLILVLEHTMTAVKSPREGPHPLIWSVNNAGNTCVDLEWMRHIEGGRGFYEVRSFVPLELNGIRNQCTKRDKFYEALLQEAVDQVIQNTSTLSSENESPNLDEEAKKDVGALLDRVVLITQVAHGGTIIGRMRLKRTLNDKETKANILHSAFGVSRSPGPYLPDPLLTLFLCFYPEQVLHRDNVGRLPLHYSVIAPSLSTDAEKQVIRGTANRRTQWIHILLEQAPQSASFVDKYMRLPLHYALDSHISDAVDGYTIVEKNKRFETDWSDVVLSLVRAFPDSVDRKDPKSCLFPFMQAAANPNSSTNTVYQLLRRSPMLVQGHAINSVE